MQLAQNVKAKKLNQMTKHYYLSGYIVETEREKPIQSDFFGRPYLSFAKSLSDWQSLLSSLPKEIKVEGEHGFVDCEDVTGKIKFEEREDYVGGSGHTSYPTFSTIAIPIKSK
jgi:hypothetical protein